MNSFKTERILDSNPFNTVCAMHEIRNNYYTNFNLQNFIKSLILIVHRKFIFRTIKTHFTHSPRSFFCMIGNSPAAMHYVIFFNYKHSLNNKMNDSNNRISLVRRDVNAMQTHENRLMNANNDASSECHHVEPSTFSESPIYETISRVYQLNDKIKHDDHVGNMIEKQIKERTWPCTKFSAIDTINETEWNEEGNYLHHALKGMNLLSYNRVKRVRFWLRHGKVVLEVLSTYKCNVASGIKRNVVQRK